MQAASPDDLAEKIRQRIAALQPSPPDQSGREVITSVYADIESALARGVALDKIVSDVAAQLNMVPGTVRAYIQRERRQRKRQAKGGRK